ncbi:MAG: hypothetical protein AAGA65_00815 [Actinomycetota bacterium]
MRRLTGVFRIASVAVAGLLLVACGSGNEPDGEPEAGATGTAVDTTVATVETADPLGVGATNPDAKGGAPGVGDGSSGIELAATPEFCAAAEHLIGAMGTVGYADLDKPAEVRWAYTETVIGLAAVADVAPNAGVANQIRTATDLFTPLATIMADTNWDLTRIDRAAAEDLARLGEAAGPELEALTEDFEAYVAGECGVDIGAARANGIDRLIHDLGDTVPRPDDEAATGFATPEDRAMVDDAPLGERGGAVFCAADRLWRDAIAAVDRSEAGRGFVDALLASADTYTSWGERIPADLAVTTYQMNVGYAEVVATYGETLDGDETNAVYEQWRSGDEWQQARSEIDAWTNTNC